MRLWSKVLTRMTGKRPGQIKKKWVFNAKSGVLNSVTVHDIDNDGKKEIIFGTKNGTLYVLSQDGKIKWKKSLKIKLDKTKAMFVDQSTINSISVSPIVVSSSGKKVIVVATGSGLVVGLSIKGKLLWKYKAKGGIESTPLYTKIKGERSIIFGSKDNYLYALSTTGKFLWKYNAKSPIYSSPSLYKNDPSFIVFGTDHGWIKAVNLSGKLKWRFKTQDKVVSKPVITRLTEKDEHSILVGSNDHYLYALNKKGKIIWKYQTHGEIKSEVRISDIDKDKDNEIFFGACDDKVYALAPNSQLIWSYETDFWIVAPPTVTDIDNDGVEEVVVGSYDKSLYVLEGKGTFALNYMPGISSVANQPGHFSAFITSQPGELVGKKIWQIKIGGIITGMSLLNIENKNEIIVSTKEGKVMSVHHEI